MIASSRDVTGLLRAWCDGDLAARDELVEVVHQELRRRAAARLRRERPGHVLQPTALVHEVYLRLIGDHPTSWRNRTHFLAVASEMMRHILVDHARRRKMAKRSGAWTRVTLDEGLARHDPREVDLWISMRRSASLPGSMRARARWRSSGSLAVSRSKTLRAPTGSRGPQSSGIGGRHARGYTGA